MIWTPERETHRARWTARPSGLLVGADVRPTPPRPVGVSLFTGAGGFDLGFVKAGWHVVASDRPYVCAARFAQARAVLETQGASA